jgi:hypothetical protein
MTCRSFQCTSIHDRTSDKSVTSRMNSDERLIRVSLVRSGDAVQLAEQFPVVMEQVAVSAS